jgi:type IV pilus assembly protein PilW
MFVIFQTVSAWGQRTATTTSGSDTQTAGATGMYYLERDLKQAGWGFGMAPLVNMGCTVSATRTFRLAPVEITQGASGAPDAINLLYGNSASFTATSTFITPNSAAPTMVSSNQQPGFSVGERAILANGSICALVTVTASASLNLTLTYDLAGTPIASGNLYNLGSAPVRAVWQINNGRALAWAETISNAAVADIADGVINLQAQYGYDGDGNNRITNTPDEWLEPNAAPFDATPDWTRVRAIRIGLLARSKQYEKEVVTTLAPSWAGGNFIMTNADGTADTFDATTSNPNNWRNYRYEVFEKMIPLRNMIWGTSP